MGIPTQLSDPDPFLLGRRGRPQDAEFDIRIAIGLASSSRATQKDSIYRRNQGILLRYHMCKRKAPVTCCCHTFLPSECFLFAQVQAWRSVTCPTSMI